MTPDDRLPRVAFAIFAAQYPDRARSAVQVLWSSETPFTRQRYETYAHAAIAALETPQ